MSTSSIFGRILNTQSQLIKQGQPGLIHNVSSKNTDSNRWKVLMYQIPVPLGDCSIYVLMCDNKIQNCFIMDGGTTSGGVNAAKQIKTAWDAIKKQLKDNVPGPNKNKNPDPLKFNSWVVTHWDQDHWRGVADLVGKPMGRDNDNNIEEYFTNKRTIIAGAVCDAYMLKRPPGIKADAPNPKGQEELKAYGFIPDEDYVGKNLIGRDLFCPKDKCKLDPKSGKLIWEGDQGRPRFVCLGAGGWGIGRNNAFKPNATRNETSILSLLYWPSTNRGSYWTGGDGFPSLTKHLATNFFEKAGLFNESIKVVKLDHHGASREFSNVTNTTKISATFMAEPFFTMTKAANPSKIIVTPGDDYGHPCWDVILFLYCWDQDRKARSATDYAASTKKSSSKKSKASDKPDQSLENITVVPNCADLVYTTKTPYWIANLKIGYKDVNTSDGRVNLADKMTEDRWVRNDDVTMLELYRELWLTPRTLDYRPKPDMDPNDKNYKRELEKPETEDMIYDREDIEQETRENLADMTCEWWNWLSRQFVQRPQPGKANGTDKFYMLKMTSVVDKAADGDIQVLTPEGEPDPLTRPVLQSNHRMITRSKLAESQKKNKGKTKEEWKQLKDDKIEQEEIGNLAKIPQENYTETDKEAKNYPFGNWGDTRTTDVNKMKPKSKGKFDTKLYENLKAFQSGLGDNGEVFRFFMKELEEEKAKDNGAKGGGNGTKRGGNGTKGGGTVGKGGGRGGRGGGKGANDKSVPTSYPRDHRIFMQNSKGEIEIGAADEPEGNKRYYAYQDESDDDNSDSSQKVVTKSKKGGKKLKK